MILKIDTKDAKKVKVQIEKDGQVLVGSSVSSISRPESILNLVDRLCAKNKIELKQMSSIEVIKGPGSYTGLKVGIAVANALSFSLLLPVNGLPIGTIEEATYN